MAETATEDVTETVTTTEQPAQTTGKTPVELQAEIDRMAKALKDANKQAASERIKLAELEKAEQARKDAELSEVERLKKETERLKAAAESAQFALLQRDVAAELGLPTVFAAKIQGADREAMVADAKAMLEALPKAKPPAGSATNPGAGSTGETDEQRRKRLGLR